MNPIVQLLEVELLGDNPGSYCTPLKWRVRVESSDNLQEPISISFVWVGSCTSSDYDQLLDTFDIGPLCKGLTEFELECDFPNPEEVPQDELVGLTILIISFQFKQQEFLRVAYYTQVAYLDVSLNEHPPIPIKKECLGRFITMPQPVVTATPINWV